jgi:hypothetical protein
LQLILVCLLQDYRIAELPVCKYTHLFSFNTFITTFKIV